MSDGFDVAVCGSLNTDLVARVTTLPAQGETVIAQSLDRWPGGKGLNQAIAAARLGARTAMQGAIGSDPEGDALRALLQQTGIDTRGVIRSPSSATGLAQVWVSASGDNSIVVHAGANATLSPTEVSRHLPTAAVYLAQCEVPSASVVAFFEGARKAGGVCILNLAPVPADAVALLALVDVIVLNELELGVTIEQTTLSGSLPTGIAERARRILSRPAQTVVVTRGAEGAVVVTQTEMFHVAARLVPVVDTTGAGDCFCGGLAAAMASGHALRTAVQRATLAASIAVGRPGAAPSMPTLAELEMLSAS